jgi:sugar phosphate permease
VVLVGILLLTLLVAYLDRVNVSVLVADPNFLDAMGITGQPVAISLLMTLFLIAYGVANVVLAPLGDLMGPRKAMCLSVLLWGLALLIGGIATTFAMMCVGRVLLGVGEGLQWPMQSKFVKHWFPPHERGKANAVWLVGLMVGPALAMPFFAWIIGAAGWRPTFFVLAAMGLAPMLLLWFFTTDHPRDHRRMNAAEREHIEAGLRAEAEAEAPQGAGSLLGGMRTFVTDYRFWLLCIFYACFASVWWGTMTWLPKYLKEARGFSWSAMGAWAAAPYLLGAVSVIVSGWLSDRVGRRAPFAALSMLGAAAGIFFGARAESNQVAAALIAAGIAAIALGLPGVWALLQEIVPGRAVGAGAGMMNGVANGVSAFAPLAIGYCIKLTGGYLGGLMFLVGLAMLGFACMVVLAVRRL